MTSVEQRVTVAAVRANTGLIEARVRRETGRVVSVYDGRMAGMDTWGERRGEQHPEGAPYSTVCEDHGHIISHATAALARAHAANPLGWCEPCMEEHA